MVDVTADDFAAALKIAQECLCKANHLIDVAGKYQSSFGVDLQSFCQFLDQHKNVISKVQEWHLRVSPGPIGDDPECEATAHRLAWRFAHRLWLTAMLKLKCAIIDDNNDRLEELTESEWDPAEPGAFVFRSALVDKHYDSLAAAVAAEKKAKYFSIAPRLQLERAQGQSAWEAAAHRRVKKTNGRTGRSPRKRRESPDLTVVRAVLKHWHQWGTDDENPNPASQKDLLEEMGLGKKPTRWSPSRLSKAMKLMFPGGHAEYKRLCSDNALKGIMNRGDDGHLSVDAVFSREMHTDE